MEDRSLHMMVGKIDQKLDDLKEQFLKVSNGTGFPRCESRKARLDAAEEEIAWMKKTFMTTIVTTILILIITMGFNNVFGQKEAQPQQQHAACQSAIDSD